MLNVFCTIAESGANNFLNYNVGGYENSAQSVCPNIFYSHFKGLEAYHYQLLFYSSEIFTDIREHRQVSSPSEYWKKVHRYYICSRYRPRFFDQVGHKTIYAFSGNKHFSLDNVTARLTKIMKTSSNISEFWFSSHFSVLEIGQIFPKKIMWRILD